MVHGRMLFSLALYAVVMQEEWLSVIYHLRYSM